MKFDTLKQYLKEGMSTREISSKENISPSTVRYYINKYNLNSENKNKCFSDNGTPYRFNKIDTIEKAYAIGFLLGDASITINNQVDVTVNLMDEEILDYISNVIDSNIAIRTETNSKKRIFPNARTYKKIPDILKFTGGRLKSERHYPKVSKSLERYLLLGFFDAEGCITFGYRKDRERLWHKISFTSQYKMLEGVQSMLINRLDISTKIHPKRNENCYVLEFANRKDVLKFIDFIYCDDFYVLKRKYNKAHALRLELEELGGK